MFGSSANVVIKILSDAKDGIAGIDKTEGRMRGLAKVAGGVVVAGLAAAATAVVGLGVAGGVAASDLEQSIGAVDAIFKGSADQMHAWADSAAQDVGLTKDEFNQLGTIIGAQLKNGGTAMDELAPKTNNLIGLGADLASMFGGDTAQAVEALSSALKGERDPIERYGVALNQASIDAKAAELGFEKVGGALSAEANQAATLALIMEQTTDAHGNFAKESETVAGQQQRLVASAKNLVAELGMSLLPVLLTVFTFLNDTAVPAVGRLVDAFTAVADGGGLAEKLGLDAIQPVLDTLVNGFLGLVPVVVGFAQQLQTAFAPTLAAIIELFQALVPAVVGFVTGTLVPAAQAIAANVTPILQVIGTTVLPALMGALQALIPPILNAADNLIALGVAISDRLAPVVEALLPVVVTIFDAVSSVIGTALDVISGIIATVTAVIKGDWEGAWEAIKETVSSAVDLVEDIVRGALDILQSVWEAGLDKIVAFLGELPGRLLDALGDLSGLLTGAAGQVIDGFIGGLQAGFQRVRNKLGELTGMLPNWKGPASRDKKILAGAGALVIGGFIDGMESQYRDVRRSLAGLTQDVATTDFTAPSLDAPRIRGRHNTSSARPPLHITINGALDPVGVARQIRGILADYDALVTAR